MHSDVATLSRPSMWREASRIVCEEGFRAFWKGNLVTIAHRLPYSSISFYAYERYKIVSSMNPPSVMTLVKLSLDLGPSRVSPLFIHFLHSCSCCNQFLDWIGIMTLWQQIYLFD